MQGKLYALIARTLEALGNCIDSGNTVWEARHLETLERLERLLPQGSGIDTGTRINREKSTPKRLVLETSFHHMNDAGMYDGWTEHTVTVTPSLGHEFVLRVGGRDRNGIKDYLADVFHENLSSVCALPRIDHD